MRFIAFRVAGAEAHRTPSERAGVRLRTSFLPFERKLSLCHSNAKASGYGLHLCHSNAKASGYKLILYHPNAKASGYWKNPFLSAQLNQTTATKVNKPNIVAAIVAVRNRGNCHAMINPDKSNSARTREKTTA